PYCTLRTAILLTAIQSRSLIRSRPYRQRMEHAYFSIFILMLAAGLRGFFQTMIACFLTASGKGYFGCQVSFLLMRCKRLGAKAMMSARERVASCSTLASRQSRTFLISERDR